jgi:hypothetical protein
MLRRRDHTLATSGDNHSTDFLAIGGDHDPVSDTE